MQQSSSCKWIAGFAALLLLALPMLSGCAGDRAPGSAQDARASSAFVLDRVDALEANPQPLAPHVVWQAVEDAAGPTVLVGSADLTSQGSLYLHLKYDAATLHPVASRLDAGLTGSALLLCLEKAPGLLAIGVCMRGTADLPSTGPLLSISFAAGPAAAPRAISTAPVTPVADLAFTTAASSTLSWTYYVDGDYDQNGAVTIGDITPVGQHFGSASSDANWNAARVADGDANNLVSISDLTPIGANFGALVTSFAVRESSGPDGPFTFVNGSITGFDSAQIPDGGGPRGFSCQLPAAVQGNYYVVSARDGTEESATYSNAVLYDPKFAPQVSLNASGASVPPGGLVILTAACSDSDGIVETLDWDLDGDGSFETPGDTSILISNTAYYEYGQVEPGVRVTDNEGLSSVARTTLQVELGELIKRTIDNDGDPEYITLRLANQKAAAAYYSKEHEQVRFVRATSDSGLTWFSPQALKLGVPESFGVGLADISGRPAVAWADGDDVLYRRALDADGQNWDDTHALPPTTNGELPSDGVCLTSVQGYPGLVFAGNDNIVNGVIWYTLGLDTAGVGWLEPEALATAEIGSMPSLFVTASRPFVSYMSGQNPLNATVNFVRSANAIGSQWNDPVTIVPEGGMWTSMSSTTSFGEGLPAVAYWQAGENLLRFVSAQDQVGLDWGEPVTAAASEVTFSDFAIANINALPYLAYKDLDLPGIRIVCAANTNATAWNEPVDVAADSASGVSLAALDGRPMLAYRRSSALEFAMFVEPAP